MEELDISGKKWVKQFLKTSGTIYLSYPTDLFIDEIDLMYFVNIERIKIVKRSVGNILQIINNLDYLSHRLPLKGSIFQRFIGKKILKFKKKNILEHRDVIFRAKILRSYRQELLAQLDYFFQTF